MYINIREYRYTVAPLWRRTGAAAVDLLIVLPMGFIPFINFALILGYGLIRDAHPRLKGRSIGKHLFGIEVISVYTKKSLKNDYPNAITRSLPLIFFCVDFVFILLLPKRRRLGDLWAKTVVIRSGTEHYNQDYIRDPNEKLPPEWVSLHNRM
jgi:uncharacterized RDD family membrane protein YckC